MILHLFVRYCSQLVRSFFYAVTQSRGDGFPWKELENLTLRQFGNSSEGLVGYVKLPQKESLPHIEISNKSTYYNNISRMHGQV